MEVNFIWMSLFCDAHTQCQVTTFYTGLIGIILKYTLPSLSTRRKSKLHQVWMNIHQLLVYPAAFKRAVVPLRETAVHVSGLCDRPPLQTVVQPCTDRLMTSSPVASFAQPPLRLESRSLCLLQHHLRFHLRFDLYPRLSTTYLKLRLRS